MRHLHPGDRLSAEDASFLYLETKEAPLHIGSVSVFDGVIPFEECRDYIFSRLPLIPRYRQRIVIPLFNFGHPTWEEDPDFDVRNHVHHAHLRRGTMSELRLFAAKLFSQKMDRNAPLWDMTVVDGLSGGRSAVISRVHHCLVDGVSGVGLLNLLLDPALTAVQGKETNWRPPALPSATASFADAFATSYLEAVDRVLSAQAAVLDVAQALVSDGAVSAADRLLRLIPELTAPMDPLPFNQPCVGPRKVAWTEISMAEVKAIRQKFGGTLNDVVLTVVTSAVRRYLRFHGLNLRNRSLRLMVPVNLRREGVDNGLGNRVSLLPVNVPLDLRDPVKLLAEIRNRTEALKRARVADLIHLLSTWMGLTPVPVQAAAGSLANLLPVPPFHMVCTNVPGPQFPLYALGHRMLTYYPYVPIANQMALGCAIQSYDGTLYFGLTADAQAVPDVNRLKRFLDDAFGELRQKAAAVHERGRRKPVQPPKVQSKRKPAPVEKAEGMATPIGMPWIAAPQPGGEPSPLSIAEK